MSVCDLENLNNEEAIARDWAASAIGKNQKLINVINYVLWCIDDSVVHN